jgi:hypothetical protein
MHGYNGDTKVFRYYNYDECYIHKNLPIEPHYLLKKPHQNPLGSFKDLSIHRDRQLEATLFYTMLLYKPEDCNEMAYHLSHLQFPFQFTVN